MSNVSIELFPNSEIFTETDELYKWLRNESKSTASFREAIWKFLEEFNNQYQTQINFSQVLDIYDWKSDLDLEQNIGIYFNIIDDFLFNVYKNYVNNQ